MSAIRHIIWRWRAALLIMLSAGLWLNALAPAGYMIATSAHGWPVVTMCPETHPLARASSMSDQNAMDHAAMGHAVMDHDEGTGPSASQSVDCAYAGLTKLAVGPFGPVLLGLALAFAILLGLAPRSPPQVPRLTFLRPPLRGPPSPA